MSSYTSMLHIRVDDDTKEQATAALEAMGLSVSDAVRIFLKRVAADQAFPLELKVPNAATRAAMREADEIAAAKAARFRDADELMAELERTGGK
jgi:DNA-damage-inducible protein J